MATLRLLLIALLPVVGNAQQNSSFHAPWVSCFDSNGRFVGPKNVRTDLVTSSDGKLRAFAEISAAVDAHSDCGNTVQLFISANNRPYRLAFTQAPSAINGTADSLGPVAWSPDGRWLAVEFGIWVYGSDSASLALLLYDSHTQATKTPEVIKQIEHRLGKRCFLGLRSVVGFDSRSRVMLRVADWIDEEGRSSSCIPGPQSGTANWLYDPATGRASPGAAKRN